MMTIRKWNKAPGGRGYRVELAGTRYLIDLTDDSVTILTESGMPLCRHSERAESPIRGKTHTGVIVDDIEAERLRRVHEANQQLASFDPKDEPRRVILKPVGTKVTDVGIELRFSREDAEKIKDALDIDAHQRALNTPFFNDLAG